MKLSSIDKINFHKTHFNPYKINLIIDDFIRKHILVHTLYISIFFKKMYFIVQNKEYIYIDFNWCFETNSWKFLKGWYCIKNKKIKIKQFTFNEIII